MKTVPKLKTWCAGGGGITVRVPVAFQNKCERVTGPQPERSIFAGVNATRTSGTGPEREPEREPECEPEREPEQTCVNTA